MGRGGHDLRPIQHCIPDGFPIGVRALCLYGGDDFEQSGSSQLYTTVDDASGHDCDSGAPLISNFIVGERLFVFLV